MRKITACILSTSVLIGFTALGIGYYTGSKIQKDFEDVAQRWNNDDGLQIEILDYERGIISSQATTQWSLFDAENPQKFLVTHDITHGLWAKGHAGSIQSALTLPSNTDPALVEALEGASPLTWKTEIDWDQSSKHTLTSPQVTATFADGAHLDWSGLHGEIRVTAKDTTAQGWIHSDALYLEAENGSTLQLSDSHIDFSYTALANHNFWTGPSSLRIGNIKVSESKAQPLLTIKEYAMHTTSEVHGEQLQSTLKTTIDSMEAPGYISSGLKIELSAKNLDTGWVDQFITWSQGDFQDEEHQANLLRSLPALLSQKPEFAVEHFSIDTPEGKSEFQARIAYTGNNPNNLNLLSDLKGSLYFSIPHKLAELLLGEKVRSEYVELLEQLGQEYSDEALQAEVLTGVQKRIETLKDNGAIEIQGNVISSKLEYFQGQIKLNGKKTDLHQLMGIGGAI